MSDAPQAFRGFNYRKPYTGPVIPDPVECSMADICEMFGEPDEIAEIDAMIDENSRYAAEAKSEAERLGYVANINRLEDARDAALSRS